MLPEEEVVQREEERLHAAAVVARHEVGRVLVRRGRHGKVQVGPGGRIRKESARKFKQEES